MLVISGALPQVAVLVAGIPFNATLLLFGSTELLDHLPVYGIFLTREQLRVALGRAGTPQMVLRIGYGMPGRPTPRRGIDDVIVG